MKVVATKPRSAEADLRSLLRAIAPVLYESSFSRVDAAAALLALKRTYDELQRRWPEGECGAAGVVGGVKVRCTLRVGHSPPTEHAAPGVNMGSSYTWRNDE